MSSTKTAQPNSSRIYYPMNLSPHAYHLHSWNTALLSWSFLSYELWHCKVNSEMSRGFRKDRRLQQWSWKIMLVFRGIPERTLGLLTLSKETYFMISFVSFSRCYFFAMFSIVISSSERLASPNHSHASRHDPLFPSAKEGESFTEILCTSHWPRNRSHIKITGESGTTLQAVSMTTNRECD